jgi:eukaryotic-like serine/threonine-protein kinase
MSGVTHHDRLSDSDRDPDRTVAWRAGSTDRTVTPPRQLGEYTIIAPLGRGGMGMVYHAVQEKLKRFVALKLLARERVANPQCVARFLHEMEAVGRLDHPHIVRAYDAGQIRGTYYLAMELVDGIDVARLLYRLGPLAVPDACEIVRQAALGLAHAHENGLVHRDIKPSNLLLSTAGVVKVADLGLALSLGSSSVDAMTGSNQLVGTVDYMAPEQAQATHEVDVRADLYSLGCTLYHLLCGNAPFSRAPYSSFAQKLYAHAHVAPVPIDQSRVDLPPEVSAIVTRLLEKQPAERYATPSALAEALAPHSRESNLPILVQSAMSCPPAAEEHSPASTLPDGLLDMPTHVLSEHTTTSPEISRRRWWALAAGGVGLAGAAAGVAMTFGWGDDVVTLKGETPTPNDEEIFRQQWAKAVGHPPQVLNFPGYRGDGGHKFDATRRALEVISTNPYFLSFGKLAGSSTIITLQLSQPRWMGSVGLFFGYREQGGKAYCFLLELIGGGSSKSPFKLEWKRVCVDPESLSIVPQGGFQSEKVSGLADGVESRWHVQIGRRGLQRLQIGSVELPKLFRDEPNQFFAPTDYEALWGYYQRSGTTHVFQPIVRFIP